MPKKKSRATRREVAPPQSSWIKAWGVRVLFVALFAAIFGFGVSTYRNYRNPPRPLHTFSAKERSAFVQALKSSDVPLHSVWLACPEGRQEVCRLVNQFITMFQESGWRVEENRVVQWKPAHPLEGVYLILQAAGEPDELTRAAEKRIRSSFTALGLPVHSASAPDVPKNSIGVYFGPDL
jgi:hypothetical protein